MAIYAKLQTFQIQFTNLKIPPRSLTYSETHDLSPPDMPTKRSLMSGVVSRQAWGGFPL